MATETNPLPSVGEPAPDFSMESSEGGTVSLADFKDKQPIVLYFYPKDDTPGCTIEACAFRDAHDTYTERGVTVLGVSPDDVASHHAFRDKFSLNFPLLADTDHSVAEKYGVWQLRKNAEREWMGIARTTFVIGKDGKIAAVFPNVTPTGHADEVLAALPE
jgi:peroxiredoxin Q/BCP